MANIDEIVEGSAVQIFKKSAKMMTSTWIPQHCGVRNTDHRVMLFEADGKDLETGRGMM